MDKLKATPHFDGFLYYLSGISKISIGRFKEQEFVERAASGDHAIKKALIEDNLGIRLFL